jgi:hypothetical protein
MNKQQHWRAVVEGGKLYIAHPPSSWHYESPRSQRLVYKFALAKRLAYTSSQYLNENGLEMSAEEFLAVAERKVHEYE